jgi:SanA protein
MSRRRRIVILAIPVVVFVLLLIHANLAPSRVASTRSFSNPADLPTGLVGLVFGTTDRVNGRENLYFKFRIEAAAALWKHGKLRAILVSGDNQTHFYNEPEKMRQALVAQGVPNDRIYCDYAGLRTLDSVVRAREIFGLNRVVFISQRFQNERAIYIANARGIEAYAFNARDVTSHASLKTRVREVGARFKMWLDIHCLNTQPKFLGPKVPMLDAGH